jgi:hypothetical protein
VDIVEGEIRATAISTQNIVVSGLGLSSAEDVGHGDVLDDDTVCGTSSRSSIEVVLLNIDTIDVDVRDLNIAVLDIGDVAGSVGVGLDSRTILAVEYFAVLEQNIGNVVVALRERSGDVH